MLSLPKLSAGALVLLFGIPSVSAKFYPDDFLISVPVAVTTPVQVETNFSPSFSDTSPLFFPSDIPDGPLTRGQFIDAVGSRLYDTDAQGTCFADLVSRLTPNYHLLFNDLSISQPLALSACSTMKNGLVRGSSAMLRPDQLMPVSEAAAVFSRLSFNGTRNPHGNEPWYQRYMENMRSLDHNFTLQPGDILTGAELRNMFCMLKQSTPQLDPMGEFTGC